jgi:ABC-type Zn2+ transport system substrate-binding protein/surface adhesin
MTMDDAGWTAFLDSLPPWQRRFAQAIMARVSFVLNADRIITIEDVQGLEDRAMNQQRQMRAEETRQDDADARMDRDEEDVHKLEARVTELEHPHGG